MSLFDNIPQAPVDPIFQLPILFNNDHRPIKVNLGIGTYRDNEGKPLVLSAVRKAEQKIIEKNLDKEYLPIDGSNAFREASLKLIFGNELMQTLADRLYGIETVGGTAALRIGMNFFVKFLPNKIYLSDPTWPNHSLICSYAQIPYESYPYIDTHSLALDFSSMCAALNKMPPHSIVLLHASCHNPTGIDPTPEQWQKLSQLFKKRQLFPFFDLAYQGFGDGLTEDAFSVRLFAKEQHEMFVAYSFAKNFGLYGERAGLLAAITQNNNATKHLASQLKRFARTMYSNPPLHGSRIVSTILQNSELRSEWEIELKQMRQRVTEMRHALTKLLAPHQLRFNLPAINAQKGIFSYLGLDEEQVLFLRTTHGIYMPENGRINIAGLNSHNIEYVAKALSSIL